MSPRMWSACASTMRMNWSISRFGWGEGSEGDGGRRALDRDEGSGEFVAHRLEDLSPLELELVEGRGPGQ